MEEFHLNSGCTTNIVDQLLVSNNLLGMGKDGLGQKTHPRPVPAFERQVWWVLHEGRGSLHASMKKGFERHEKTGRTGFLLGGSGAALELLEILPQRLRCQGKKTVFEDVFFS